MDEERRVGEELPVAQVFPAPVRMRAGAWATERTARRLWVALAAVAAAASVAPLWSSRLLPFQDAPEHLAAIRLIADYSDPALGFSRWFVLDYHRLQYLGFYLPAALFAKVIGPDAACRLMLSVIAIGLMGAIWMLLGAFGRDRRLALLAPVLFHSMPTYLGFFNFVESVPAAIALIACVERELHAPKPGRAAVLVLCTPLLLWLHPSALAFVLGSAVLLALTSGEPRRRQRRLLVELSPGLALFVAWAVAAVLSDRGPTMVAVARPSWSDLPDKLIHLARFGDVLRGHADELAFGILFALWLALAFFRDRRPAHRSWRLPMIAALALAAYLALPFEFGHMGFIALRAVPFFAAFLLVSPRIAPGRAISALLAAAVFVQVGYMTELASAYRAFDQEAQVAQLDQVLAAARPGARLLGLIWDRHSHVFQFNAYLHFAQYYELERGGRARVNFAETPWTPVRYRPGTEPVPVPEGWEDSPWLFNPDREGAEADYLLVRGAGRSPAPPGPFVLRARAGDWSLYAKR